MKKLYDFMVGHIAPITIVVTALIMFGAIITT